MIHTIDELREVADSVGGGYDERPLIVRTPDGVEYQIKELDLMQGDGNEQFVLMLITPRGEQ